MGLIASWVGGAADALAEGSKYNLIEMGRRETMEAEATMRAALAEKQHGWDVQAAKDKAISDQALSRQKFGQEMMTDAVKTSNENRQKAADRASAERIAKIKDKTGAGEKVFKTTDEDGNDTFVRYDPESEQMVPLDTKGIGANGLTFEQASAMANKEADAKASIFNSDQTDFGMTRPEWVNKRTMELMGQGPGATGSQAGAPPGQAGVPAPSTPTKLAKPASYEEYAKNVRAANPGVQISDADLKTKYQQKFGGAPEKAATARAAAQPKKTETPAPKQGLIQQSMTEQKRSPQQKLYDIEQKLAADDKIKKGGFFGQGARAIQNKTWPLGVAERMDMERRRDELKKQLGIQ